MTDLERLFNDQHNLIYSIVYAYVGKKEDAEEIISESFCRACKYSHAHIHDEKLLSWFIKILRNSSLTFLKSHNRIKTVSLYDVDGSYEQDFLAFELYETIKKMIIIVPEDLREPIKLHLIKDIPLKRIAKENNIVYSRLRYWLKKYLEAIKPFI